MRIAKLLKDTLTLILADGQGERVARNDRVFAYPSRDDKHRRWLAKIGSLAGPQEYLCQVKVLM
jgi:hypothetical protein